MERMKKVFAACMARGYSSNETSAHGRVRGRS
jgi:hypothetical protein